MNSTILVYECEGSETEIKEWFKTINTAGIPLNEQELLNAVYSGPFTTMGRAEFSNSQNSNVAKWGAYVSGTVIRQDYWERALEWASKGKGNIPGYMSMHRFDNNIDEVKNYFNGVIDWASSLFSDVEKEMCGLEWGRLYETYHSTKYDLNDLNEKVQRHYGDGHVKNRKGIWEYLLGGEQDVNLLDIRIFDEPTKKSAYAIQTKEANENGISNCPLCRQGHQSTKAKIWRIDEMDADHVTPWSRGGSTSPENCQLLCKTHNRSKGNR